MADEVVDTNEAPAEGVEPTEPTEVTEPTEPVVEELVEPTYITADQLSEALTKQEQSNRSWLGRRDKEMLNHVGTVINERFTQNQNQPSTEDMSSKLLDNPRDVIRSEFKAFQAEETAQATQHLNSTMETVGNLMEADPLYSDSKLGNEVVAEVKNLVQTGKVNTDIPSDQAGRIMLGDALSNVFRKRQGVKTTTLDKNTPGNTTGSINPASGPPARKVKVPQLDDLTKKMADKWGYSGEDLAQLYGE